MTNLLYKSCVALIVCGWIVLMFGIFLGEKVTYIGVGMTVMSIIIVAFTGIINKFSVMYSSLK